jgi:hypothetical protein
MTPLYKPRPERWPQFTLRTFFVLFTLLCVFLGWLGVQVKWIRNRREALEQVSWMVGRPSCPARAPWGMRILGEPGVARIWVGIENVERMHELQLLFPEALVIPLSHTAP